MDNKKKSIISHIDELLYENKYEEFNSYFTDELMQNADYDEIAYLSLFALIYRKEKNLGLNNNSLSLGSNSKELIRLFKIIKFLLWEFEFDNNDESTQLLINTIVSNNISVEFIRTVIMTSSVNKEKVITELSKYFS